VTIRAAIVAKDARQSDDQPVNDAPSGADIKDAAPTHAAREKSRRGPKAKPAIKPSDIQGLKYFDKLKPLLARLHDVGTERDKANNRDLHMDEYCILVLMWLFNDPKAVEKRIMDVMPPTESGRLMTRSLRTGSLVCHGRCRSRTGICGSGSQMRFEGKSGCGPQ
jgi:hypothetical protein